MYSLLLRFSISIGKEDDLFKDLKNEILKLINSNNIQLIYHMINDKSYLLFVETINIRNTLVQVNKLQINGNICYFKEVADQLSSYIQIKLNKLNLNISHDIYKVIETNNITKFSIFTRNNSILIQVENISIAQNLLSELYSKFNSLVFKEEIDIVIVSFKEFVICKYIWHGQDIFSSIITKLKSSGRSFINVIQGFVLSWEEVPCIIDTVQQIIENQVYILFPTEIDKNIFVHKCSIIDIFGGKLSYLLDDQVFSNQTDIYILWIFDQCLPKDAKNTIISTSNISDKIDDILKSDWGKLKASKSSKLSPSIKKFVFVEKISSGQPEVRAYITKLSNENDYIVKVYDKNMSTDIILRPEVTKIVSNVDRNDTKPMICFVLSESTSMIASLKQNDFKNIVLFSTSNAKEENKNFISRYISWQLFLNESINKSHEKTYLNVTKKLIQSEIKDRDDKQTRYSITDARKILESSSKLRESKSNRSPNDKSQIEVNISRNMTSISDLQCLSIAAHYKHLMLWTGESTGSSGNELKGTLLFGEEAFSKSYEPNDVLSTNVMIVTDSKAKVYQLIVSGPSQSVIQRRNVGLQNMATTMLKFRKTYPLPAWDPHHRECLIGSNPLIETEKSTEASALLHINEGTVVLAEVVALTIQKHRNMKKFLEDLVPRHIEWTIPYSIANSLKEKNWSYIKLNFAVKVDQNSLFDLKNTLSSKFTKEPQNIKLKVWGFESYLDNALEYLLSNCDRSTEMSKKETIQSSKSPEPDDSANLKASKLIHGSYVFQDREAGIYYSAFEKNFRVYITGFFNVTLSEIKLNAADGSPENSQSKDILNSPPSSLESQSKSPALKIEFWGNAQNVKSLRSYLDQLNMKNLLRYQFHFPSIDSAKYREICNEKSKEDYQLKEIRLKEKGKLDDPSILIDPVKFLGFINIRIKPPLNNRGIKRMTFPVDATLTVCGPVTNLNQRKCIEDTLKTLKNIKSGYFELKAVIPLNTPLAKELTSKVSRQQYTARHNLLCIRWEEAHRPTGGVGITHIWSKSQNNIETVHKNIIKAGGSIEDNDPKLKFPVLLQTDEPVKYSVEKESTHRSSEEFLLIDTDSLTDTNNPSESFINTFSVDTDFMGDQSFLSSSSLCSFDPTPHQNNYQTPHIPIIPEMMIYWPQIAYKYMFQADPLKSLLLNKLIEAENSLNVKASFIVNDPNACLTLSGPVEDVEKAKENINQLFKQVSYDISSVEIILSLNQFNDIIDRGIIADIEVADGVHVVDNPLPDDTCDTLCSYDFRFAAESNLLSFSNKTSIQSDELISTILRSENHNLDINIVVMKNEAGAVGWTWGVSCLIMILDEWSSNFGLSTEESESLKKKEVLVNMDAKSGKIILRVKPDFNIECTKQSQAESYMISLCKALSKADDMGINGVVFMTPSTVSESFSELSTEMIKSLTVEGSIGYLVREKIKNIRRVVFLEDQEPAISPLQTTQSKSSNIQKSLTPAYGNRMALAIIVLMDKFVKDNDSTAGMEIIKCNFPIPFNMPFSVISKPFPNQMNSKQILIRGLPINVVVAVDHMKDNLYILCM